MLQPFMNRKITTDPRMARMSMVATIFRYFFIGKIQLFSFYSCFFYFILPFHRLVIVRTAEAVHYELFLSPQGGTGRASAFAVILISSSFLLET
jgi:hypothetical protein